MCGADRKGVAYMDYKILDKQALPEWLESLAKQAKLIAPVERPGGEIVFSDIKKPDEITLDYVNTLTPPKQFMLPQIEPIIKFKPASGGWMAEAIYDEEKRIIFGIRPCDVSAIKFLDQFFSEEFQDIYYLKRRENTTLISLTCQEPGGNCFCVCADCGPFVDEGFDLQLTDLGDCYLVEIGTDRGRDLVTASQSLFTEAKSEDIKRREELPGIVETRFKQPKTYFSAGIRKISAELVPEQLWQELGERCLACGGCSYACPTCSCFNVTDYNYDGDAVRVRSWDSCALGGFTRMAGGHNPRKEKQDRRNRRFYHKLSYYYVMRQGKHGCVGCGRCIGVCLGGIGMPEVVGCIKRDDFPSDAEAKSEV